MDAAGWTISIIAIAVVGVLALSWERAGRRPRDRRSADGGRRASAKHEFMSPPWIAMARREITNALAGRDLGGASFTLSEEFTDPPPHLAPGSGPIGFSIRIVAGDVEVVGRPEPEADLRIISDYADALPLARDPDAAATDPHESERRIADGRLRIEGDPALAPPELMQLDIHRLLAGQTA